MHGDVIHAEDHQVELPVSSDVARANFNGAIHLHRFDSVRQSQISSGSEHRAAQRKIGDLNNRRRRSHVEQLIGGDTGRRSRGPFPKAVVEKQLVRRNLIQNENVGIAVVIEIAHNNRNRRMLLGCKARLSANGSKRSVSCVGEQFDWRIAIQQQQIKITVVVEVGQCAIAATSTWARRIPPFGCVEKIAVLVLQQKKIAPRSADVRVDAAVAIDVAEQNGIHRCASKPSERVIGFRVKRVIFGGKKHERVRIHRPRCVRPHHRAHKNEVEQAIAIEIHRRRVLRNIVGPRELKRLIKLNFLRLREECAALEFQVRARWNSGKHSKAHVAHSGVLKLGVVRARVLRQLLKQFKRAFGARVVAGFARTALNSQLRALQQRIKFSGANIGGERQSDFAGLLERLCDKVLRVGIVGVSRGNFGKARRGRARVSEVELAESDGVARAKSEFLGRIGREKRTQLLDGIVLRTVARLIENRDGTIENGLCWRVRRRIGLTDDLIKRLSCCGKFELTHEADGAIHRLNSLRIVETILKRVDRRMNWRIRWRINWRMRSRVRGLIRF